MVRPPEPQVSSAGASERPFEAPRAVEADRRGGMNLGLPLAAPAYAFADQFRPPAAPAERATIAWFGGAFWIWALLDVPGPDSRGSQLCPPAALISE